MAMRAKFMCNMWRIVPVEGREWRRWVAGGKKKEKKKENAPTREVTEHTLNNVDENIPLLRKKKKKKKKKKGREKRNITTRNITIAEIYTAVNTLTARRHGAFNWISLTPPSNHPLGGVEYFKRPTEFP